uniref:MAP kinase-activating death domain protein n=1 Tax=Ditylenchus dipsaci TaxID=166011 RepID=A0A915DNJ7_9BILA
MLEYKVVLQSRNYSAVSMCVLALVALMYPLEYMFPVIPLLPACMGSAEQLLLAPTPYIIGLPASFFAVKCIDIPTDVVFVDLDTNEVIFPQGMDIHMFPEPEASDLKDAFRRALGKMSSTNTLDNSDTVSRSSGYESGHAVDGDEIDVAVRVAMVRFFNSANIFANFSEHSRTLRLYPRPVVALQTESFLRSRPQQTDFIVELCKTQAVEYFSECSLCPRNETYVRVQAGITNPTQIGDKSKWFTDQLMPIHFNAYPNSASLSEALYLNQVDKLNSAQADNSDGEDTSDLESTCSGMDESVYFSDSSSLNNNSRPPTNLEMFKPFESALSIESSISSGRSSPASSLSASAIDSEADFARLADNLALKSDSKGDFTFDHENDTYSHESQYSGRRSSLTSAVSSTSSTPTGKNVPGKMIKGKDSAGEKVFGPQLMDTINGYAEKSQGMLSQVFRKTAPKLKQAQALRDKTMRPLAEAAANKMEHGQHLMNKKTQQNNDSARSSLNTANTQRKNQQLIAEVCDQIIAGQGVGVFTYPKVKRLLEDESLRELACSKLQNYTAGQQRNCPKPNLDDRYSVDEFVQDVQLTRAQYKGYLKVLQACVVGLESSFNLPGSNGLASLFHVLEIAHTHFWAENEPATPGSGIMSLISTPSGSNHNLSLASTNLPNSDLQVAATIEHDLGAEGTAEVNTTGSVQNSPINQNSSHSQESAATAHASVEPSQSSAKSGSMPPTTLPPPLIRHHLACSSTAPKSRSASSPAAKKFHTTTETSSASASICNCVGDTSTPKVMDLVQQTAPNKPIVPIALVKTSEKAATQVTAPEASQFVQKQLIQHYLYKDLIMSTKTDLWQKMVFWENAFFDMVAQEEK